MENLQCVAVFIASEQCYCVKKACYFLIKHFELTNYVDFWNSSYAVLCHRLHNKYKILVSHLVSFCQDLQSSRYTGCRSDLYFGLNNLKPKKVCQN